MTPEELIAYAQIIEEAKKQQMKNKLELNKVRVLEEKKIEKLQAPVIQQLKENESKLEKAIQGNNQDLKNEFYSLIEKSSSVKYRFNSNGSLNDSWKYISSNSEKNIVRVKNINSGIEEDIVFPNRNSFMLLFSNPERISGLTKDDIGSFMTIAKDKLNVENIATVKSLRDAVARLSVSVPTTRTPSKKGKKKEIDAGDGEVKAGEGLVWGPQGTQQAGISGQGIFEVQREMTQIRKRIGNPNGSGISRGKSGNLLYNNKVLMKKLQLMLAEQDAGNNNLKKEISMFLDEAKKRGLIEGWMHKKTMRDYVLKKK